MNVARIAARLAVGALAAALATSVVAVPGAQAAGKAKPAGTKSLAQVLAKDKKGFDHNPRDFDVLTAAVGAVLAAKPASPVKVLADGKVPLTAFLPTDRAFQDLVRDITAARKLPSERQAFAAVAGLGIGTVESVLLYHVVPGATVDRRAALKANGARLATALGATVTVQVRSWHGYKLVYLADADTSDRNPRVVAFNLNVGNRQIAHAIDRVLRPVDLP